MNFRQSMIAAAALVASLGFNAAHAVTTIVNLDATKGVPNAAGQETDAAPVTVSLAAGSYSLSVIDNLRNGGYNGYNYNDGPTIREAFDYSIAGGPVISLDVGATKFMSFATSADAIAAFAAGPYYLYTATGGSYDANRVPGSFTTLDFTLPTTTSITFAIPDNRFGDNKGGVSLAITAAVPEPETYALMLGGLGALGFVARRRKPV